MSILTSMEQRLFSDLLQSQEIIFELGDSRLHEETISRTRNRNPFQRDYSRVMYSNSFRRLQGKMQLMEISPFSFTRNRLTHSLEVAQVARSIADIVSQWAKEIDEKSILYTPHHDLYVIETGALAHDIGNPPFGHHGEVVINDIMKDFGGFEGNAQGIRNIMHVEKKLPDKHGLNLAIRSILSILKYDIPYTPVNTPNKFIYANDYSTIHQFLSMHDLKDITRTMDVQIVDMADEIAYCAHDLEDALSQQFFSIDEFIYDLKNYQLKNKHSEEEMPVKHFEEWVSQAKAVANSSTLYSSSEEYSFIFRKELTSIMVNNLISNVSVIPVKELKESFVQETGTKMKNEIASKNYRLLIRGIKHCTFEGVNRSSNIQLYERTGTKIIKGLFELFVDKEFNKNGILLPVEYRFDNKDSDEDRYRKVSDYISGMMDIYAISTYKKYFGEKSLDSYVN